jgi:hypothetical protein
MSAIQHPLGWATPATAQPCRRSRSTILFNDRATPERLNAFSDAIEVSCLSGDSAGRPSLGRPSTPQCATRQITCRRSKPAPSAAPCPARLRRDAIRG